jgi:hypothetical protein
MTEQQLDDSYPESWRPSGAPPFNEPESDPAPAPLAMELHVGAMTDEEFESFVRRARGNR